SGVRTNIEVGIRYIAAWLCGRGAVPIHNLMEDAATAEISRAQIWQWLRHSAPVQMEGGFSETMSERLYKRLFAEEVTALKSELGDAYISGRFEEAATIFTQTASGATLPEFLTIPAYAILEA
ncbi:MAG: malate synthase A, partial [Litorimonas sp.]